ncbi:MAG TPA: glycosyltransferase, partial [Acidimicrobiales bacterium]|nr:glycosyltransferase [Acidimicrobiales bacterium]
MTAPVPGPLAGRRVLLVTFGSVLRPDGGLAVRARATIEALVGLGAHLTVVSHHEPPEVATALAGDVDMVTLSRPLHLGFSTELVATVRAGARWADLIVVESALFLPAVIAAGPSAPIVWDTNECETLHYRRLPRSPGNLARRLAWRFLEGWAARRVAIAVAISETEAEAWRRLFPRLAARTVTVAHRAHARPAAAWRPAGAGPATTVLLFVGNALGKHNARAVAWLTEVLAPQLPPSTVLVLAGRGTDVVPAAGGAAAGAAPAAAGAARVIGLGLVDDIDAVIAGADICLAPLHAGAGVKTKVLHYLAHGKAVIATPAAMEGIEDAPGVTVAEMDGFAAAVLAAVGPGPAAAVGLGPAAAVGERAAAVTATDWMERRHGAAVVAGQWADALLPLLDHTLGQPAPDAPS